MVYCLEWLRVRPRIDLLVRMPDVEVRANNLNLTNGFSRNIPCCIMYLHGGLNCVHMNKPRQ